MSHARKLYSEELVKQAVERGDMIPDNVFTRRDKIGSAESYEKLISEYWVNYQKIRDEPKQDLAKKNYLDSIARLSEVLSKTKVMEKDYLTQINILKEKREQDNAAQRCDVIEGWYIPAMLEKCKDNEEANYFISKLEEYLYYIQGSLANKDRVTIAKDAVVWLYDRGKGVIP